MKQKMKHLQSLVAVALCIIFAMSFISCSKDDEPEKPKVEKRMTSLDDISFVYSDDGKISQQIEYGEPYYNFKYTSSSIIRTSKYNSTTTFTLKDGLITSFTNSDLGDDDYEITYENGRIKSWKGYSDGEIGHEVEYEWKDGVIVRQIKYSYYDSEKELHCDYQYSYTSDLDYGGAVACFQSNSLLYDYLPEALVIQGYFGKLPKYLVASAIDASPNGFSPDYYTWTLDSDGYAIRVSDDYNVYFTWENLK